VAESGQRGSLLVAIVEVKAMTDAVVLGKTPAGEDVVLSYDQRRQHAYVIGVNGTGKTTLLRQIARSDMLQNPKHGLCVIDPHGDLIDDIIAMIPPERLDDVILFDPSDEEFPFCLNLFAPVPEPEEIGRVASEIVAIFRKIFGGAWTPEIEGVIQNVTLTLLARPRGFPLMGKPWAAAMDEIPALLAMERVEEGDEKKSPWRRRVQTYRSQFYQLLQQQDQIPVWEFWNYSFDSLTPRPRSELTFAVLNQVRRFLANPTVRNIVAQTESKLDLAEVMKEGQILLVNLSKGQLGEANSAFLGSVIVAKLVVAVFARAKDKLEPRRPFHIIVDEFQNFAISSFPMLLSEARKYSVDLVIAHQYRDQLRDWVQGATVNAGNIICFRLGGEDAREMALEFDSTPQDEVVIKPFFVPSVRASQRLSWLWTPEDRQRYSALVEEQRKLANRAGVIRDSLTPHIANLHKQMYESSRQYYPGTRAHPDSIEGQMQRSEEDRRGELEQLQARISQIRQQRREILKKYEGSPMLYVQADIESDDSRTKRLSIAEVENKRPFIDVVNETANNLAHLPNYHARCRLSGSDNPSIEQTFRTVEWPEGHDDAAERQRRYDSNVAAIRANTQKRFTRPRQEVVQEFQERYEIMLRSIGMTWTPDKPLPTPEILYEEDD
jgi:hypothetical protein